MVVKIIRVLFVIACVIMGVIWAGELVEMVKGERTETLPWQILGGVTGCVVSLGIILLMKLVTQELFEKLMPSLILIVMSMVMGYFLARYIMLIFPPKGEDITVHVFLTTTLVLIFVYPGIVMGLTRASSWQSLVSAVQKREKEYADPKVIDTSVIIDGRILDICKSGFIEGTLIIPRFVLQELQAIADSSEVLRRAKGRRGLDILKEIQSDELKIDVRIVDDDPENLREVDEKLVRLARDMGAKIITNDFNLNKVAQIEGVQVLNINDLANALKPAVLPDEQIEVKVIKEGKEAFQGVGYLDDGTMVVVDGAKEHVGRHVTAVVTSVLQTAAGRMIFTKLSGVVS